MCDFVPGVADSKLMLHCTYQAEIVLCSCMHSGIQVALTQYTYS